MMTRLMLEVIGGMTSEQIREAVVMVSRDIVADQANPEARMVRAHLIDVFISREGEAAGDALMESVGL